MSEYRGEDKYTMPMSDREEELMECPTCGALVWDVESDGTCLDCQDAYLDAMESRIDHAEGDDNGND